MTTSKYLLIDKVHHYRTFRDEDAAIVEEINKTLKTNLWKTFPEFNGRMDEWMRPIDAKEEQSRRPVAESLQRDLRSIPLGRGSQTRVAKTLSINLLILTEREAFEA